MLHHGNQVYEVNSLVLLVRLLFIALNHIDNITQKPLKQKENTCANRFVNKQAILENKRTVLTEVNLTSMLDENIVTNQLKFSPSIKGSSNPAVLPQFSNKRFVLHEQL